MQRNYTHLPRTLVNLALTSSTIPDSTEHRNPHGVALRRISNAVRTKSTAAGLLGVRQSLEEQALQDQCEGLAWV